MYINLLSHNHISEVISVKNETNGYMRLFSGVLDVNLFLTTQKSTDLCSYLDKWTTLDFIAYRVTEYSWIVMLIILDLMNKITDCYMLLNESNNLFENASNISKKSSH